MHKKMLLLVLCLAMLAGALATAPAQANNSYPCPQCTTDPDGVRCCSDCWCENVDARWGPTVVMTCSMALVCEFPEGYW